MQNKPAHTPDSAHTAALAMGAPPAVADWVRDTYAACLGAEYYVYDDGRPGLAYGWETNYNELDALVKSAGSGPDADTVFDAFFRE